MSEPILSRERIAQQADQAAFAFATTGKVPQALDNPYPAGSDAAAAWKAAFERYLLKHSAPQAEGGA